MALTVYSLLFIVAILVPLILSVAYLTLWERKLIGWIQIRLGPNRVGPWGLLQPFADVLKLLLKEIILPANANKALFILAPVIMIMPAIAAMDADVISIETSRSRMELLDAFVRFAYPNEIGPGVYDIHSPRVPDSTEMLALLRKATAESEEAVEKFREHKAKVDGIAYMSRYIGNSRSVVLFDRCDFAFCVRRQTPLLLHPEFARLCNSLKLAIDRGA